MGKFIGKLAGKKVVVVGGSSGIGYGAAEAFVALGADVAIVSSSPERVEAAVQRLQAVEAEVAVATKPQVQGVVADVRDEEGFTAALLALAPVDHLVFSAVDTIIRGPLAELDVAQAQHLFGVKFWGSVRVGKALAQHEIVRPGGSLTLTSGAAAYRHSRDAVVGGALNAGVINLTHSLAAELAGPAKRIRVNTVVPGLVKTPLWDKLGHSAEAQEHIFAGASAKLSVGFVAGPDDIAEAYVYAARADYANGTVILIDGGSVHVS